MELNLNRRQFVAAGTVAAMGAMAGLAGCSSNDSKTDSKTDAKTDDKKVEAPERLVFAWEPGASEGKYENMRDLIAEAMAEGAGVPCEPMTTTDYNVCIEAVTRAKPITPRSVPRNTLSSTRRTPQSRWPGSSPTGKAS